jgi:hypothetical protein
MNSELSRLDLDILKNMYESKVRELMNSLNSETSWESMSELRETLYELSIIMYEKVQSADTPVEIDEKCKQPS